jgi:hypothetical protein
MKFEVFPPLGFPEWDFWVGNKNVCALRRVWFISKNSKSEEMDFMLKGLVHIWAGLHRKNKGISILSQAQTARPWQGIENVGPLAGPHFSLVTAIEASVLG